MFDGPHGDLPPEIHLLFAILIQAVEDLESSDEKVRFEAHEFFLQPKGGWREARDNLLTACGLDEEAVRLAIKDRLQDPPPENPSAVAYGTDKFYHCLPQEAFTTKALSQKLKMHYPLVASRLQCLKRRGLVRSVDRGVFMRTDSMLHYTPKQAPKRKPPMIDRIHDALKDGPKTIREILFEIEGDAETTSIRKYLDRLIEQGKVERDPPHYQIRAKVPAFAVAANQG